MDSSAPQGPDKNSDAAAAPKLSGFWNSVLTTLPVALAILATAFAGMSSSEMTQAMYYRSLAAQQQSKAGDQWAFFQAKRTRGTSLEMTAELLQSLAQPTPFDPGQVDKLVGQLQASPGKSDAAVKIGKARDDLSRLLADESIKRSLAHLTGSTLPRSDTVSLENKETLSAIEAAVKAIRQRQTEEQTAGLIRKLNPDDIAAATRLAEQNADNFDQACKPVAETIAQLRKVLAELGKAVRPIQPTAAELSNPTPQARLLSSLSDQEKGFKLAVLQFDALRYRQESNLNRAAAEMYEVRVRRSGIESDRHREMSKMFFYSMLIAQLGVTVASLALARQQRKSLWLFAALAGMISLGFTGYIYLTF